MRAAELMTTDVITLAADATIAEAIEVITEHEVRHVPLVHDGVLVAVVSDRDLHRVDGLIARDLENRDKARRVLDAPIASLVTGAPVRCDPDTPVDDLIDLFVEERLGAVIVTDDEGFVLGIVSVIDVLLAAKGKLG